MNRFAISSWSLDGMLQNGTPLVDVPAQMAQHGITTLEVCHFHLPGTDAAYLQQLRDAIEAAGIELYSVLIDGGDIVAPDPEQRAADMQMTQEWIDIAAALGAQQVRVAAGRQPATPDVIQTSAQNLRTCAQYASDKGLRTITENWLITSQEPDDLLAILDGCNGTVGLCADTGNAEATADKYATLEKLLLRASSVHFKAQYQPDGAINQDDARRCTALMQESGFDGVVTLIYADKHDEWAGIERMRNTLEPLLFGDQRPDAVAAD
jgi:sugar phosphate isomerase/epimerase